MRVDLRYISRTVWDTFPWPQAPTDDTVEAIVDAGARLLTFREERLAEGMTLEAQYNSLRDPGRNPLRHLQKELDAAVAAAYGFDKHEDELAQLVALNQSIAKQERSRITQPRRPGNTGLRGTKRTSFRIEPPDHLYPRLHSV